jgi:DNA-directed RNA polymerase subunit RPC12/RpoP
MIVNMACPKCGGQSTEYDENKWSCLRCGNKFIFAPEQPSQTFVQSNVHIEGQATFELDAVNIKPPSPKMVKMAEHDPDYFTERIANNAYKITDLQEQVPKKIIIKYIALFFFIALMCWCGIVVGVGVFAEPHDTDTVGGVIIVLIFFGLLSLIPFYVYRRFRREAREYKSQIKNLQQANLSMEQQNLTDTKIGDYIICPYCTSPSDYVALKFRPPVEGLKHCLKCGRQFFTSGLNSYPVLFKK